VTVEHLDVLIVGAGLSGIGAASHLQRRRPGKSVAILEARDALGGTWDLFRYPGVRSDSDMFTLGYSFRPWTGQKAIADGATILEYVRDTARDQGVEDKIRFHHRVVKAEWSTAAARWTVTAHRDDVDQTVTLTCSFLWACSGYYRYDRGYSPTFPGAEKFSGPIVHPQHWPDDLDYAGRRVVVIGSGATAVTLLPALAERAAHVTMVQRSPSYIVSLPSGDPLAKGLRRRLPSRLAYWLTRWKNVLFQLGFFQLCRRRPEMMKAYLRRKAVQQLPSDFDVDTHLAPRYNPWDQRLCIVPDGDLFRAIRNGTADIVTGEVETFTESGIALASGEQLEADIIVTATGLDMIAVGGLTLEVDGRSINLPDTLVYKGMMLSDVPNFALTIGYSNASWTLKADLVANYVCRLLDHMDRRGYQIVTPVRPEIDNPDELTPLVDLKSGYVQRNAASMPKQGPAAPWRLYQNYVRDVRLMRRGPLTDEVRFGHATDTEIRAESTQPRT
jgi:monooxygenase